MQYVMDKTNLKWFTGVTGSRWTLTKRSVPVGIVNYLECHVLMPYLAFSSRQMIFHHSLLADTQ